MAGGKEPFAVAWKKHKYKYMMIAPFALIFILFTLLPVLVAIFLSFTNFNMVEAPEFTGLGNYVKLMVYDPIFLTAIKNTLFFAIVTGPVSYLMCFLFAWLVTKEYIMPILILVQLWLSLGVSFLTFIAGFQSLDKSLLEAGSVEGIKNRWQELWYIILPSMKPQLMFGAVMQITGSLSVAQLSIDLVGFPSVSYAGHTILTHLHDFGNVRYELGYACTVAVILFFIMLFCNIIVQKLLRKLG